MGPRHCKGRDEQSLLREMLRTLHGDDILLGDAFYSTYFLLCELIRNGVDNLFEQHDVRKRITNSRKGGSWKEWLSGIAALNPVNSGPAPLSKCNELWNQIP